MGFELFDMVDGGYTATELKAAQYSAEELKEVSFSAGALRVAGFTSKQLQDALYSLRNAVGGGSRIEVMLPFASPFNESALHASPLFFPVVRKLHAACSPLRTPLG